MANMCKAKVFKDWHHYPCSKKATKDGWCGVHHPEKVKARLAKIDDAWTAERAKMAAEGRHKKAIASFCAGFTTEQLEATSLRELVDALRTAHVELSFAYDGNPAFAIMTKRKVKDALAPFKGSD